MLKKQILTLLGLLALCIAGQVMLRPSLGSSEEIASKTPAPPASPSELDIDSPPLQSELIRQFFYMIGFVALIGLGAWLVCRKMSGGWRHVGGRSIQLGETVRMGPRKAVHLIHVGQKTFLVGSTTDSLCLLADVSDSVNRVRDKADE